MSKKKDFAHISLERYDELVAIEKIYNEAVENEKLVVLNPQWFGHTTYHNHQLVGLPEMVNVLTKYHNEQEEKRKSLLEEAKNLFKSTEFEKVKKLIENARPLVRRLVRRLQYSPFVRRSTKQSVENLFDDIKEAEATIDRIYKNIVDDDCTRRF